MLLTNGCLSFGSNANVGFIPFIICLLTEGKFLIMTVGSFLLMQRWNHAGSQMEETKLTGCC